LAEMGSGYGSECHLLRYLGRHRNLFDDLIRSKVGADAVRWLDFHFDSSSAWLDGERKGIDFLPIDHPAWSNWRKEWPQRGNPPNWDAVGVVTINGQDEWLLIEAKAHTGEMISDCHASQDGGLPTIRATLDKLKRELGVAEQHDWLKRYYQYANRLAVLHFLLRTNEKARLLFIYFIGDKPRSGVLCPQSEEEWHPALSDQSKWLGLNDKHAFSDHIYTMFIPTIVN
jgi:hypothetical protein